MEEEEAKVEEVQEEDSTSTLISEFTKQIEDLKQQLKEQQDRHNEEIKQIIQSVHQEKPKSQFDLEVEKAVNEVNKYRKNL